jgi:hypothetical protein
VRSVTSIFENSQFSRDRLASTPLIAPPPVGRWLSARPTFKRMRTYFSAESGCALICLAARGSGPPSQLRTAKKIRQEIQITAKIREYCDYYEVHLLRSAPGKDASSGEKEKLIEEGIVSLQFWEMFFTGVPVLVTVIGAIHKHGQRLGKIEAKLDVLYDDVRALEKYN